MHYYQRYGGDYAKKTAHLTLVQHGAYTLLLDAYYATEAPLPASLGVLCRICRAMTKAERDAVRSVVDEFFPVGPDGLRHNRKADEVIGAAAPRIVAARTNGKHGGRPRKNPVGFAEETQQETQTVTQSEPTEKLSRTRTIEPKTLTPLSSSPETPPAALDVVPLGVDPAKPSKLTKEAIEVLTFLNDKTRRHFRPSETTLKPIRARLKEGFTVAECRAVIARKFRAWSGDPKMAEFLRPSTLFGAEKFAQYVGEVPPPEELSNAS